MFHPSGALTLACYHDTAMYTSAQIIAMTLLPGISSTIVRRFVDGDISFERIARSTPERLARLGMKRGAIEAIAHLGRLVEEGERMLEIGRRVGGSVITLWDDDYPRLLREIYSPPAVLYVRGSLVPVDSDGVAIVGTRGASTYGRLAAERYAAEFSAAGVTVVSGLARGIDSYAHAAAVRDRGRTIAVVASGVDRISPNISERLAEKIAMAGAIISEHPFEVQAVPSYFPRRNRIISGVTRGTLVIESDERGGAMITAGFAMDQNREVFALPGPVTSPKSRGTNLLIRTDRARLTQTPRDVLEALGFRVSLPHEQERLVAREDLTIFEARVYDVLGAEPLHADALCELADLPASDVLVTLLTLEFKGLVRQMAGKMFLRV